jgi:hypothetical protein
VGAFLLSEDLLAAPRRVFLWYHSPSIYLFPDLFLASILNIAGVPYPWHPLVYSTLFGALLCLAGGAAIRYAMGVGIWLPVTVIALLMAALQLLDFFLPAYSPNSRFSHFHELNELIITVFQHSGAVLSVAAGFALVIASLNRRVSAAWLFGWVALSVCSDLLSLAWLAAPAILVSGLLWWTNRAEGARATTIFALTGGIIGLLAEHLIHSVLPGHLYEQTTSVADHVVVFFTSIIDPPRGRGIAMILVGIVGVILLFRGLQLGVRLFRDATWAPQYTLELLLAVSLVAGLVAPIAAAPFLTVRYFLILWVLPILWASLWLTRALMRRLEWKWAPPIGLAALMLVGLISSGAPGKVRRVTSKQPLERCLEQKGLRDGFGDYLTAKSLIYRSKGRFHIAQITADGVPYRLNFNEAWFFRRAEDNQPANFNYIIASRLDPTLLRRTFGEPAEIFHCGADDIWRYKTSLGYSRPDFGLKPLSFNVGPVIYPADKLPGQNGQLVEGIWHADERFSREGNLTYGPYIRLRSGKYRADIIHSGWSDAAEQIGRWDLVTLGGSAILAQGVLLGTRNDSRKASFEFEVPQALEGSEFEIRTFFDGRGHLEIHSLTLTRELDGEPDSSRTN